MKDHLNYRDIAKRERERKHMKNLGKSRSKKEHERYKSCVGLTTLPSLMFMLSSYDSIVR